MLIVSKLILIINRRQMNTDIHHYIKWLIDVNILLFLGGKAFNLEHLRFRS